MAPKIDENKTKLKVRVDRVLEKRLPKNINYWPMGKRDG